jgi:hypothetical protein
MTDYTNDLRAVSEERVPLPDQFAISQDVLDAAQVWPTAARRRIDIVCAQHIQRGGGQPGICGQIVLPVSQDGELYEYTDEERQGLVLAHLMQRHGWTRETIGER